MSDSNLHLPENVPTLVVGGKAHGIKGGNHIKVAKGTPLTNLQLTLLHRMGVDAESFGDSTGEIVGL
jgi:hypothetical protein